MKRYTLKYTSPSGRPVVLYNLGKEAVARVRQVQSDFGVADFEEIAQPRTLSDEEIKMLGGVPYP